MTEPTPPSNEPSLEARVFALETRVHDFMRHTGENFETAEKAVTKAETAAEKRFESVNEFRSQLADQQATFATKTELDYRFKALEEKVATNSSSINVSRSDRLGLHTAMGYIVGAIGLLSALAAIATFVLKR
jgi:hypothetical protein